jgi:hypothetical protein
VYAVGFALLALVVALLLATSDVCMSVKPLVDLRMPTESGRNMAMFYFTCNDTDVPPSVIEVGIVLCVFGGFWWAYTRWETCFINNIQK